VPQVHVSDHVGHRGRATGHEEAVHEAPGRLGLERVGVSLLRAYPGTPGVGTAEDVRSAPAGGGVR